MTEVKRSIWVGYDPKEALAYFVAVNSIKRRLKRPILIRPVSLSLCQSLGWYKRPTSKRDGHLYDEISEHPMSTEFAIARFLVPHFAKEGWALFMDCDMLVQCDLNRVFDVADPKYAVMCVKQKHEPTNTTKMSGEVQSQYYRKNWSSFCLFNCDHPQNKRLFDLVQTVPGRDLHRFCWLADHEIGELEPRYNYLAGAPMEGMGFFGPSVIHYTEGGPWLPGKEFVPYATQWKNELEDIVLDGVSG